MQIMTVLAMVKQSRSNNRNRTIENEQGRLIMMLVMVMMMMMMMLMVMVMMIMQGTWHWCSNRDDLHPVRRSGAYGGGVVLPALWWP
eukprot:2296347-Karenia_brevis.AAC.1